MPYKRGMRCYPIAKTIGILYFFPKSYKNNRTIKRVIPNGITLLILYWKKGLERSNATRISAAGDGLTEPNINLLPLGADANESLPVYLLL